MTTVDYTTKSLFSTLKVLFDKIAEAGDFPLRESLIDHLQPIEPERPTYRELVDSIQNRSIVDNVPKAENGALRIGSYPPVPMNEIDSVVFYSSPDGDIDIILTEGGKEKPLSNVYSGTIKKSRADLIPEFQRLLTAYNIGNTDLAVYKNVKVPSLAL